ncbi:UNVERIFIED_CONTAM: hypothetical protein FKN15_007288 [Acipenser sinensis]
MNTRCPPKHVPSAARFFTLCRLTVRPPQSYSVGGQRSSWQLTGKPAGARPDYRGRWCATIVDPLNLTRQTPQLQTLAVPQLQRRTQHQNRKQKLMEEEERGVQYASLDLTITPKHKKT